MLSKLTLAIPLNHAPLFLFLFAAGAALVEPARQVLASPIHA
jgi:hypothetical protein